MAYGTGCSVGALVGRFLTGGATLGAVEAASVPTSTANAQLAITNRSNRRRRSRRSRLRSACRAERGIGRLWRPTGACSDGTGPERCLGG
jgi:hypothetical protein